MQNVPTQCAMGKFPSLHWVTTMAKHKMGPHYQILIIQYHKFFKEGHMKKWPCASLCQDTEDCSFCLTCYLLYYLSLFLNFITPRIEISSSLIKGNTDTKICLLGTNLLKRERIHKRKNLSGSLKNICSTFQKGKIDIKICGFNWIFSY